MFIQRERLGFWRRAFIEGAPDLVVEVLSERSRRRDQVQKRALYAMAGVPEYWLVDPAPHGIVLLTLVDEQYTPIPLDAAGVVMSRVLPGFPLDPATLFAGLALAERDSRPSARWRAGWRLPTRARSQ